MVNEIQAGVPLRSAMRAVQAMLLAAGCPEPDVDARELVRLAAGQDPLLSERLLTAPQAAQLQADAARRAARTPLQYIEGHWPRLKRCGESSARRCWICVQAAAAWASACGGFAPMHR